MPEPTYRLVRRAAVAEPAPSLDAAQRAVVEHRGGPLLVLAGPGTGKTTAIVEAVVHRVEHDGLDPAQVLALTFGRRAAAELRDRIAARLRRTIREPVARTFHSYAFGLLRSEAVLAGEPAPRLLSGPEQDLLIRDLLRGDVEEFEASAWPERLRPALLTRGFAEELRDLLLRAAERGIDPTTLGRLGRRHRRDDWVAAATFARQYRAVTALRQTPSLDPAELVRAAVDLLASNEELLARERQSRTLILVDEFQDSDPAQVELLELVAGGGRDLIVVGDPDQSIYAFRGAEVDGIRRFGDRFRAADGSPAATLELRTSRRGAGSLLAATRRVAAKLGGPPAHRVLTPPADAPGGDAEVHLLRSASQEASYVASRLREEHLAHDVPWSKMAVLVRGASALPVIRRACANAGVPTTTRLEEVALVEQPAVQPLLRLLEIAAGRRELDPDLAVELVCGTFGAADPLALRRLRQELRAAELRDGGGRASGALLVEALTDPRELTGLDPIAVGPAERIGRLLAAARTAFAAERATAETVLWAIWEAADVAESWSRAAIGTGPSATAADANLDAVTALFDMAARFVDRLPAAGPEVFLDHVLGQEIPSDTLAARAPDSDAVALLTAHAAKGLEWDVVAVVGVQDGTWPDLRPRGSLLGSEALVDAVAARETTPAATIARMLAEERRLFYVAVTRARRRLLVTAVLDEEDHPSRFLDELLPWTGPGEERPYTRVGRGLDLGQLVAELRSVVTAPAETVAPVRREAAADQLARLAAAGVRGADPSSWYGLPELSDDAPLRPADEPVTVSPSKVEAYNRCALRWLLEASGGTAGDSVSQGVGNLVHDLAHDVAAGRVELDDLATAFEERWPSIDAGPGWYAAKEHDKARALVERLEGWLRSNPRALVAVEGAFEVLIGRARVTGRIDRLERDAEGRLVVVDLKTGKTKPANAELPNHPQLASYQLAIEHGGFDEHADTRESGGAMLLQLGSGRQATEQQQPPLRESADPEWAERLVTETAEGMAGSVFHATANRWCGICPVRRACPVHGEGGQVTP